MSGVRVPPPASLLYLGFLALAGEILGTPLGASNLSVPPFAPERIVAALNANDVAYVIVGGLAVAAHSVVRATRDLGLVPKPSEENLERLAGTLAGLGAEHPIDGALTGPSFARPVSFKLRTNEGDVQVLNRMPAVPPYAHLRSTAIPVDLGNGAIASVCSLADLRAMKLASGRPRDLVDVGELDDLHGGAWELIRLPGPQPKRRLAVIDQVHSRNRLGSQCRPPPLSPALMDRQRRADGHLPREAQDVRVAKPDTAMRHRAGDEIWAVSAVDADISAAWPVGQRR